MEKSLQLEWYIIVLALVGHYTLYSMRSCFFLLAYTFLCQMCTKQSIENVQLYSASHLYALLHEGVSVLRVRPV